MTEPTLNPTPAGGDDDESTTFVVAVATAGLGFLSLVTWLVLWAIQYFSEGDTIALVQHRWWFLVAGVGLTVLGIGLQAHRIGEFVSQRRSLVALNVVLMTLLAVVLTVLANYVGSRHYKEFDWTHSGVYSISDESEQVVAHLTKPLRCWIIWPSSDESAETVRRLLDHYKAKSDKLTVENADPTTDLAAFELIVKKLGLEDRSFDEMAGVVVQSGYWEKNDKGVNEWHPEKSKHLSHRELFESSMDPMSGRPGQKKFKGEQVITNAIIEVTEPTRPKLYFLKGHHELDLEGQDSQSFEHMGFTAKLLRQKNYDIQALDLLSGERKGIPEDCTVLVIALPKDRFDEGELSAIDTYLKGGGKLLALMSPNKKLNASNDKLLWAPTGLEPLLRRYNVECQDLEIIGFERLGGQFIQVTPKCYVTGFDTESKVTQPLASTGARCIFYGARPLKILTENPHARATELGRSSDTQYAVPDRSEFEESGGAASPGERKPWPVLVSVEQKIDAPAPKPAEGDKKDEKKPAEKVTRLIVAGDGRWVSNPLADAPGFRNEALFFNCISYLVGQERFTKEPAKESNYKLDMDPGLVQVYSALSLVGMPLFAIVLGMSVWMIRRR